LPLDIMLLDVVDFPRLHERSGLLKDDFETGVVELRTLEVDEGSDFPVTVLD
jgi:hypothetical protein